MGDDSLRPRLCTIRKWSDFPGYGFNLHAERGRAGQYIGKVDDDSPAQAAGMKEGDRIVEVEGVNIGNENHAQVVTRIKAAGESVTMLLVDTETDNDYKSRKVVVSSDMPEVLRLQTPPRPGTEEDKEMEAQADNDKSVPVTEGESAEVKDTQEPDSEPVVVPDDDDRKSNGSNNDQKSDDDRASVNTDKEDEVVKAVEDLDNNNDTEDVPNVADDESTGDKRDSDNEQAEETVADDEPAGVDAENIDDLPPPEPESEPPADEQPSYNEAQEAEPEPEADRPPSPDTVPVPVVTSHNYHPRLCIIRKWPDFQGYGFNLHAEKEKKGQYIGLVDANSPAEDADLRKGDRIIEVNGDNIEDDTHQQVIQKIKAGGDVARMLVVDKEADDYFKNNGIQVTADMPEVITNETRNKESSAMTFTPRQCHVIKRPDFPGYGFNLHAEKERGGQYIGQIDNNSPAQEAGLKENDRIIEVNGANIENETHQQVIARIKSGGDETKLLVVDREADNYYKSRGVTVTSTMSEVRFIQSTRPSPRSSAVTNGDSSPTPAPQPTRVEPVQKSAPAPAQANGGDFMSMNLSAKEMREMLARKKKNDPKQKSNMDFKSKYEIFQKM